jgi:hypothetical protein
MGLSVTLGIANSTAFGASKYLGSISSDSFIRFWFKSANLVLSASSLVKVLSHPNQPPSWRSASL